MASHLFSTKPLKQLLEEMHGEQRLRRVLGPVQLFDGRGAREEHGDSQGVKQFVDEGAYGVLALLCGLASARAGR